MTMTSPAHAMAYAHISELLRTAAASRRTAPRVRRRPLRSAAAAALHWYGRGQLGVVNTCADC